MEHIAIDLGGKKSQVCVRDAQGKVIEELRCETAQLGRYLEKKRPSRVIVETSSGAFHIANQAIAAGHEVRVVPATLAPTLGVGARGVKTDKRDARALSEVSTRIDLPSVHIPSDEARERKAMCGARSVLISAQTNVINHVRAWLRERGLKMRTGATETFAERVLELGETVELPDYLQRQLLVLLAMKEQIAAADKELQRAAEAHPVCTRLMTVPGVGPLTAMLFVAVIDQVERVDEPHRLESYLGLTPGERSSSERTHRTAITKAGCPSMRRVLVQAAWVARTRCKYAGAAPLQEWAGKIASRRGSQIATVALARKLAGILYALWRDGTSYEPLRAAKID